MKKIVNIFNRLRGRKASSPEWELARQPRGSDEAWFFSKHPEFLISPGDSFRDRLHNLNYLLDIRAKKSFARFTYFTSALWIFFLFSVVLLQGFGARSNYALELLGYRNWILSFHLETSEFIAFITTTTATILGFAYLVGKYLFGQTSIKSSPTSNTNVAETPAVPEVAKSPPISAAMVAPEKDEAASEDKPNP